jgi:hypothetical protein
VPTTTALWLLLAAGTVWHLLLIAYVLWFSPTLSVDLKDEYRHP